MNRRRHLFLAISSVSFGVLSAAPVYAASLQQVAQSDWWAGVTGFPSYVNMYIYVPDKLATKPPVVVGPHHCGGTGTGSYSEMSGLVSIANSSGFILIFPEATGQNCWDAGSDRSLNHGGKGDAPAVVQMVKYTLSKYSGDASRVYSVGSSSGGIMTEALLGVFPDVFMAGVSLMGVPCGCWAASYNDVVGKPASGTGQWSGPCAGGTVVKTGQEWATLVRSYYPGYSGHRPRLQHWHGTADTTLNYKNMAEDIKEWTSLFSLSETPTGTDTPKSGTTRQFWKNACGYTVYETFSMSGVGHAVPLDANAIAVYFGLDKAGSPDPEAAACGAGGTGGTGGTSGTAGAGGVSSSGGASTTGGRTSTGGSVSAGGNPATGGKAATGGAPATGGNTATGGRLGAGGSPATGGQLSAGGNSASGGTQVIGGAATALGGSPITGGNLGVANGGTSVNPGGGSEIGGSGNAINGSDNSGCACAVGSPASSSRLFAFALGAFVVLLKRRKRV